MIRKAICLSVLLLAPLASYLSAGTYSGGDGTAEHPYRIATPNDLNEIGNHVEDFNKCFVMVNDVNLADYTGTQFNIIGNYNNPFTGIFDGNGHTISNFTYESTDTDCLYIAIFGYINDSNAEIKNLTLMDPNLNVSGYPECTGSLVGRLEAGAIIGCGMQSGSVSGDSDVGGLVGRNEYATISDCYATGSVAGGGPATGGLVGWNWDGTISNCYVAGNVSGECDYTGGLVGGNHGTILNCYAVASVSGDDFIGGLVGDSYEGTILNCYATGSVSGNQFIGGLVGYTYKGTISNCYATGNVTGEYHTGGLAGENSATISDCYATGSVSGRYSETGGLVAINYGTIENCYARGEVSGHSYTGGLVGTNVIYGILTNCYSQGSVTGEYYTGGLVGENSGTISDCYAAGLLTGTQYTGGLAGYHYSGFYESCFWDSDVNPDVNGIGNTTDPNVIGESTANMKRESTFTDVGWDFVEIWNIGENQTYPYLRVYPAGDLNHDGRVDFFDFAIAASHWLEGEGYD